MDRHDHHPNGVLHSLTLVDGIHVVCDSAELDEAPSCGIVLMAQGPSTIRKQVSTFFWSYNPFEVRDAILPLCDLTSTHRDKHDAETLYTVIASDRCRDRQTLATAGRMLDHVSTEATPCSVNSHWWVADVASKVRTMTERTVAV